MEMRPPKRSWSFPKYGCNAAAAKHATVNRLDRALRDRPVSLRSPGVDKNNVLPWPNDLSSRPSAHCESTT